MMFELAGSTASLSPTREEPSQPNYPSSGVNLERGISLPRPGIFPPTLNVKLVKDHVSPWSELRAITPLFGSQLGSIIRN